MTRRKILYLGTDPKHFKADGIVTHMPLIEIIPRDATSPVINSAFQKMADYTHIIFTSKNTVRIFMDFLTTYGLSACDFQNKIVIAVGAVTQSYLNNYGIKKSLVPKEETQEGLVDLLSSMSWNHSYVFLPGSSIARDVLKNFLKQSNIEHQSCDLYDTVPIEYEKKLSLDLFDEIVFTSPSVVKAFFSLFETIPNKATVQLIGPITKAAFSKYCKLS